MTVFGCQTGLYCGTIHEENKYFNCTQTLQADVRTRGSSIERVIIAGHVTQDETDIATSPCSEVKKHRVSFSLGRTGDADGVFAFVPDFSR